MDSQEKADAKAAFRKPSSDAGNRKYRRRSSTSPSPPPAGSPERRADGSHHISRKESARISDDGHRRKDDRELDETSGRNGRSGDSHRHGRHSPRRSRDYRRHDDYRDDEDRDHSRLAHRSARDSKDGRHYDHKKNENDYRRSRDGDKYSRPREINDDASYKNKHNEKDGHNETRGSRSIRGENTTGRSSYDDARANHGDSSFASEASGRRTSAARSDDVDIVNYQKSSREDNKKCGTRETKLTRERETRGSREYDVDELGFGSRRPLSPSKKAKLASPERSGDLKISEKCQGTFSEAATQPFSANDVDAAKVAAIRAAELVNKNLVGVGVAGALSTDQKKKLLWGNKKKAVEESGHIWDASLFPDREQQEKFNRLMSLRLPWCLWPIVGCEGGGEGGAKASHRCRETEGAAAGFRETVYSWAETARWAHSRLRPLSFNAIVSATLHYIGLCSHVSRLLSQTCCLLNLCLATFLQ